MIKKDLRNGQTKITCCMIESFKVSKKKKTGENGVKFKARNMNLSAPCGFRCRYTDH